MEGRNGGGGNGRLRKEKGREGRKEKEEERSKQINESSLLAAVLSSITPGRSPAVMH